jgi:hypothetical protein
MASCPDIAKLVCMVPAWERMAASRTTISATSSSFGTPRRKPSLSWIRLRTSKFRKLVTQIVAQSVAGLFLERDRLVGFGE